MKEIDINQMPFEILLSKKGEEKEIIVCKRYFTIKKFVLQKAKSLEFLQTFTNCVKMIEDAISEASALFLSEHDYMFFVKDSDSLSSHYTDGDIVYIESEDAFYEYRDCRLKRIGDDWWWLRKFVPLKTANTLVFSLYYNHPKGERMLLSQAEIDISRYPSFITQKIDIRGKSQYWEHAKKLIPSIMGSIYYVLRK